MFTDCYRQENNMPYAPKFKEEDFEKELTDTPKAIMVIAKAVGCSKNTAKTYLSQLEIAKKARKATIEGCPYYGWVKGEGEDNK